MRPKKARCINGEPITAYFKPRGIPLAELKEVTIEPDEFESLRLAYVEKVDQTTAAKQMGVLQSTFQRLHTKAKQKVADAIVHGKAIRIRRKETHQKTNGGEKMPNNDGTGPEGKGSRTGHGRGKCAPKTDAVDEEATPRLGLGQGGRGRRMGRGRGFGRGRE